MDATQDLIQWLQEELAIRDKALKTLAYQCYVSCRQDCEKCMTGRVRKALDVARKELKDEAAKETPPP